MTKEQFELLKDSWNVLRPLIDHDYSSCSDDNPSNGIYTHSGISSYRCTKCALMNLLDGPDFSGSYSYEDFHIKVSIGGE